MTIIDTMTDADAEAEQENQSSLNLPVTASQIQGQGNQDGNYVITRNHSANNMLPTDNQQVIEVKPVSEAEIANIFTFYNASKAGETKDSRMPSDFNDHEKQFTFQGTNASGTGTLTQD